jgi:hypothetical protein
MFSPTSEKMIGRLEEYKAEFIQHWTCVFFTNVVAITIAIGITRTIARPS